jgi:hypothetical protein
MELSMRAACRSLGIRFLLAVATLSFLTWRAEAQSCQTSSDLDDATRSAITTSGQHYFDMAAKEDAASLRQNATSSLAAGFSNIESAVKDNHQALVDAKASPKSVFLLEVNGTAPLPRGEFYCGVFGKNGQTPGSAIFYLDNLQPGKYGVVILDAVAPKTRSTFSVILQKVGNDWKLGGLYIRPATSNGHDSDWFAAHAREYKAKGQTHNAWLYFYEAWNLASPLSFMSTASTDKLYEESQTALPADIPSGGKTADLAVGTITYKLTSITPYAVGDDLDLIVKYKAADVSNTNQAYQNNMAVIKALVAKFPEVREAFAGVVARAVDPSGRDYGTLLAMKDIK